MQPLSGYCSVALVIGIGPVRRTRADDDTACVTRVRLRTSGGSAVVCANTKVRPRLGTHWTCLPLSPEVAPSPVPAGRCKVFLALRSWGGISMVVSQGLLYLASRSRSIGGAACLVSGTGRAGGFPGVPFTHQLFNGVIGPLT